MTEEQPSDLGSGWPDLNRRPLRPELAAVLAGRFSLQVGADVHDSDRQPL